MADSKKYNGSTWEHSLRKLATATDTFTTLPVDVYADGNNATVGISGNTVQNGTPTPDNPIMPQGTGERTENLFDKTTAVLGERVYTDRTTSNANYAHSDFIEVEGLSFLTVSKETNITTFYFYVNKTDQSIGYYQGQTAEVPSGAKYVRINMNIDDVDSNMLVSGSTPLRYEPYGIKIPILSANTTTPVYLGEVQTTRRVKKLVMTGQETLYSSSSYYRLVIDVPANDRNNFICSHFGKGGYSGAIEQGNLRFAQGESVQYDTILFNYDNGTGGEANFKAYLQQQYANGTPVTVWYVLATATTGTVNEPLMKIGDYADTVSGITIPTITGKDTFDVLTTLKPSEASLNYTGWHDATIKEWNGSQWNE